MKAIVAVVLLASLALAADAPKLTPEDTLKVQGAYARALLDLKDKQAADTRSQASIAEYKSVLEEIKKNEKLPETDDIQVGPDNKTVTVVVPAAAPAAAQKK